MSSRVSAARRPAHRLRAGALPVALLGGLAACGPGTAAGAHSSTTGSSPTPGITRGSGPVDVLYAGSLVDLMEKSVGPAFDSATGYTFTGFPGGSSALAHQIKDKVRQADVFVSASPKVNATLEGPANGEWVSWYATFATSPLVLGYNPSSKFAPALRTQPWYDAVGQRGFHLGRTDPATDPKGVLAVQALKAAAAVENQPGLNSAATSPADVYPEETLVGRLQAGQLDAGFFYLAEARAAGIPTVALTGQDFEASYTITVIDHASHQAAADAFVDFLLGSGIRTALEKDGFVLVSPPQVTGTGLPSVIRASIFATG
jgi:molybdate/tungstate transport system substrate-binding protein